MQFITTCTMCNCLDAVELLLCSSFSFLNKLLAMSLLWYLQPASNKHQGPKWACLTYCMHVEPSYITAKLVLSDLPFVERSACQANPCKHLLNFTTLNFWVGLIFSLTAHPRNLGLRTISLIQRLRSITKSLLREYFRKYGNTCILYITFQRLLNG